MYASLENRLAHEFIVLDHAFQSTFGGDEATPTLNHFTDLLGATTFQFGLCELHDRRAQRLEAIGEREAANFHLSKSQNYQARGLEHLDALRRLADDTAGEIAKAEAPSPREGRSAIDRFAKDLMDFIADSELKPKDVGRIEELVLEALTAVSEGNLGDLLIKRVEELSEARRSEDRGNRDNLPWWKIVIIAAYLGLAVWKIWRCTIRKRCRRGEKAAIEAAAVILGISLKFC